jgi:hypothetical protein
LERLRKRGQDEWKVRTTPSSLKSQSEFFVGDIDEDVIRSREFENSQKFLPDSFAKGDHTPEVDAL